MTAAVELKKSDMGRVLVPVRIENQSDLWQVDNGLRAAGAVRTVEVEQALVDTGCAMLGVPTRLIEQLGLKHVATRTARTTAGPREARVYESVRLTVQGRDCPVPVVEVPDSCPVLVGQVPLELMDFVVHPQSQRLIGNPEHGGELMYDMF